MGDDQYICVWLSNIFAERIDTFYGQLISPSSHKSLII